MDKMSPSVRANGAQARQKVFPIPEQLFAAILEILKRQPYEHVAGVMTALQQLPPIDG
jgi:hypothetical protein